MDKLRVRHIVGWRERESQVRRNKVRMRESAGAFRIAALRDAILKKKTTV